jgi:cytochrome c
VLGTNLATGLAADLAYGEYLASECVSCHRMAATDAAIPAIVGLPAQDFVNSLRDYRTGRRSNPVMQNVARSLDNAQIEALAAYFASLKDGGSS